MERDGELDHAQAAAEVAARLGDGLDDRRAQLPAQLLELLLVHLAQVARSGQVGQKRQEGPLCGFRVGSRVGSRVRTSAWSQVCRESGILRRPVCNLDTATRSEEGVAGRVAAAHRDPISLVRNLIAQESKECQTGPRTTDVYAIGP